MTIHQQPLRSQIEYAWKQRVVDHSHAISMHNQGVWAIRNRWRLARRLFGGSAAAKDGVCLQFRPWGASVRRRNWTACAGGSRRGVSISERLSLVTFFVLFKESNIIAILSLLFLLNSCSLPSSNDLIVTSLRCSPSAFDSFRTNTEIRYTLAKPASVTIFIAKRDASGALLLVKMLAQSINETKGSHGHTWLGDTEQGLFAESGLYIAVLQIQSNQYETSVRVFHF